jgi:hypothetical protein
LTGLVADTLKVVGGAIAGFLVSLLLGRAGRRAREINSALSHLDDCALMAERAVRANCSGEADKALLAWALGARTDLGIELNRLLGGSPDFKAVSDALSLFSLAILPADPDAGIPLPSPEDGAAEVRLHQQSLRHAILSVVDRDWWWRLYKLGFEPKAG